MIRPDRFISVAEETGLIVPIGKWVIREACRQARELAEAGLGELQIAINLSPKQFTDPDLVGSIAAILHEENIPASQLELELTESLLLDATDDTRQQLRTPEEPRPDPGDGRLRHRLLVTELPEEIPHRRDQDRPQLHQGHSGQPGRHGNHLGGDRHGPQPQAQGSRRRRESAEQLAFLRRNRCDIGQGYLFDRPIPSDLLNTSSLRYPCRTLH